MSDRTVFQSARHSIMETTLFELKERLESRVAKLEKLGNGEESKRQKKREYAAIGKLRKRISEAANLAESSKQEIPAQNSKRKRHSKAQEEAIQTEVQDEGPSKSSKSDMTFSSKATKNYVKNINHKLAGMSTRKQLKKAQKLFRALEKRGLSGDVHTFTILINCCVRCGDLDQAKDYLCSMKTQGLRPNIVTVTTLMKGLCEAGTK